MLLLTGFDSDGCSGRLKGAARGIPVPRNGPATVSQGVVPCRERSPEPADRLAGEAVGYEVKNLQIEAVTIKKRHRKQQSDRILLYLLAF
ncbi:hypothetical protein GL286_11755 [Paracoccus aestuariivivens]|uniref:Uncharacterized protein n=1 Tax=Paracoccus aestuariivivens TaxID=1820333 RepID=A0A6L6JE09_9RHOB|nr:hypothetical protein [Paracoccus aestuariivivens]